MAWVFPVCFLGGFFLLISIAFIPARFAFRVFCVALALLLFADAFAILDARGIL